MKIKNIKTSPFNGDVFNFSVDMLHNYVIHGIVVSNCHYCYTSATSNGVNFEDICNKGFDVWGKLPQDQRPFQIAIGGAGESTLHPDWCDFVKIVKQLGIVPNYTTNGMHLSQSILDATEKYCGGVALSWHPHISKIFHRATKQLSEIKTRLNFHIIVGSEASLEDLKRLYHQYSDAVDYFVILPYQAAGRGQPLNTQRIWLECFKWIRSVQHDKFAFGALFYEFLRTNKVDLPMAIYEPEMFSGYRMLDDSYDLLRRSSYDLRPKKEKTYAISICV